MTKSSTYVFHTIPTGFPRLPAEYMRLFSDPGIKWRLCISLYYSGRHPSLLPFRKSLYQDTLGQVHAAFRVHALHESHFGVVR